MMPPAPSKEQQPSWFSGPRDRYDAIEMVQDREAASQAALDETLKRGATPQLEHLA